MKNEILNTLILIVFNSYQVTEVEIIGVPYLDKEVMEECADWGREMAGEGEDFRCIATDINLDIFSNRDFCETKQLEAQYKPTETEDEHRSEFARC